MNELINSNKPLPSLYPSPTQAQTAPLDLATPWEVLG